MKRFAGFSGDPVTVAHNLLGQRLVRMLDGRRLAGVIVEVEAYLGAPDRAAHTYKGRRTARNESMYLGGGHAYVYFTYGMHHCLNVVCGGKGDGTAVLLRAREPIETARLMLYAARQARVVTRGISARRFAGKRPKMKRRVQLQMLQGLPGIGPERACRLLDKFGSIDAVLRAEIEELMDVSGVGMKTATTIRWVVS